MFFEFLHGLLFHDLSTGSSYRFLNMFEVYREFLLLGGLL